VFHKGLVRRTIDTYGRIDVLINNAGVGNYGRMFDVNVFAAEGLTSLVMPYLRSPASGSVVNISSISAIVPTNWNTMYCASKSAVHSFAGDCDGNWSATESMCLPWCPASCARDFRENVLAGEPPAGVLKIRSAVSPDALATAIAEALRKRRSLLFFPPRGTLYYAMDLLLTPITDLAIRHWHTPAGNRSMPSRPALACEEKTSMGTKVG
jgi:short-subunit dehydrogenase